MLMQAWHCTHLITILLFMRRWYSSCAWLDKLGSASANRASSFGFRLAQVFMPLSPVTVPAVTKGSSNRSLRRAMISFKSLLSCTITCGWLWAKAIGAVIDLENWCKVSAEASSLALCRAAAQFMHTSALRREPIVLVRCA